MTFRKLRIAWSVIWSLAAVLLIVLWVRSYWWLDGFTVPVSASSAVVAGTLPGVIAVGVRHVPEKFRIEHRLISEWRTMHSGPSQLWGGTMLTQSTSAIYIPCWPLALVTVILAGVPWRKTFGRRFSLRTLLIVTTLVAVVLGLIVAMLR
jgi:hypothetical protein